MGLLGRKAKEEAPFSQATRVTVSYSSFSSFSNFTAKNLPVTIVKETVRRNGHPYPIKEIETGTSPSSCHPWARIANRYPADKIVGPAPSSSTHTRYHCLEWNGLGGAASYAYRSELYEVTSSTNCATALADNGWTTVITTTRAARPGSLDASAMTGVVKIKAAIPIVALPLSRMPATRWRPGTPPVRLWPLHPPSS